MNAQQIAFVFPGQGSQTVGMGRELAEVFPTARNVFQEADELLHFPLSQLAWEGPEEALNDTVNTQPALLVHSVAALRVFHEQYPGFEPAFVAGHSMGELSALVACRALPFASALQLTRQRGVLMKRAGEINPGGMAAVIGLDIPTLDQICTSASRPEEIVQVANDNSIGQVVISGASSALERAMQLAKQAGARKVTQLAVSIAAHSPLMENAQEDFNRAVDEAQIQDPHVPLVGNVTATALTQAVEIRADLRAQLTSRVRWTESVQSMVAQGITTFIELGSGSVLTSLLKRIDRSAAGIAVGSPADFDKLASI